MNLKKSRYIVKSSTNLVSDRDLISKGVSANVILESQYSKYPKLIIQQSETTKWNKDKLAVGQLMQVRNDVEREFKLHSIQRSSWYLELKFQ